MLTTCNHAPATDRIVYELATKGRLEWCPRCGSIRYMGPEHSPTPWISRGFYPVSPFPPLPDMKAIAAAVIHAFAAGLQNIEPLPPESEAHARRGRLYADAKAALEGYLRNVVASARGEALEEFTAAELAEPSPTPALELARAKDLAASWSSWVILEERRNWNGIDPGCIDHIAGELIAARQRGREELAPMLRRAVGIVSDLHRVRNDVDAVLDAYAAHRPGEPPPPNAKTISASRPRCASSFAEDSTLLGGIPTWRPCELDPDHVGKCGRRP
jgi:hypothetical protein